MNSKIAGLLGLMRRANAIDIGEVNTGSAAKSGKAKIIVLAADASDNAARRADTFAFGRLPGVIRLPLTKAEISSAVGVAGCSMAAINDAGFAAALIKELLQTDPDDPDGRLSELRTKLEDRAKATKKNNTNGFKRRK